ncbi:MAG: urease accessory protein [Acidimicrobiaceae bacterium]|nr:urease accessory protein [Acidimicrobiaceae bacterium]
MRIARGGIDELYAEAPFAFRVHDGVIHAVQAAGGPVGGDELSLLIVVEAGATAVVRSVAAQLVLPGPAAVPCRVTAVVHVEDGATLDWAPEPTVLVAGSHLVSRTTIHIHGDARLRWRDVLVLGRFDEPAGRADSVLRVSVDDHPVVHHEPDLSPFGVGPNRVIATIIERDGDTRGLVTADPRTYLHLALADSVAEIDAPAGLSR